MASEDLMRDQRRIESLCRPSTMKKFEAEKFESHCLLLNRL